LIHVTKQFRSVVSISENPVIAQVLKRTWIFLTIFIAHPWTLFWSHCIQSTSSDCIFVHCILILYYVKFIS